MMAGHASQKGSDLGEKSSFEANTKQERRVDIEKQIKVILQEINILKKILANVETRVIEICEKLHNVSHPQDQVQPLPEL